VAVDVRAAFVRRTDYEAVPGQIVERDGEAFSLRHQLVETPVGVRAILRLEIGLRFLERGAATVRNPELLEASPRNDRAGEGCSGVIDLLVLAYVAFSAWRGRARGMTKELPGAVGICVFAVTGWGLFMIMFRGLEQASAVAGVSAGIFSFFVLLTGSVYLWRRFRKHVRRFAETWRDEQLQRRGGMVAGGLRAFVLSAMVLLILAHWPLQGMTRWIVQHSSLGRALIRHVLPVYDKTHGVL